MLDAAAEADLREARRLIETGAFQESRALCDRVIARFPDEAAPHLVLAELRVYRQAPRRALEALDAFGRRAQATALSEALRAMANMQLREPGRAIAAAERAMALPPDDVRPVLIAGEVLSGMGRVSAAISAFRAGHAHGSDEARLRLAAALHVNGDFEEAAQLFRETLAKDANEPLAWFTLTQMRANALTADDVAQVKAALTQAKDVDSAVLLAHALAKTQEDRGDHAGALQTLLGPKHAVGDAWSSPSFDAVFAEAPVAFANTPTEAGEPSDLPIFIVGMPRSGTTLAERILSSHPEVHTIGETDLFGAALSAPGAESLASIGADYVRRAKELAGGVAAPRLVDKLPSNFLHAGLIHRALPNARIICMRRGAMDTIIANYMQYFTNDPSLFGYVYDLADTARYYAQFDKLIEYWRTVLPVSRFTELHYEKLVADQEGESRRLIAFCGLDWDPRCLAFHENIGAVQTASAAQVRQPLYASSVGRWKRYGAGVQPALDVLAQHGIDPDAPPT